MNIMDTQLGEEITNIMNMNTATSFYWGATIHSGDFDHKAVKVLNIDTVSRFEDKFASELTVTLVIPAGVYTYRLIPMLNQTEITLHRYPTNVTAGGFAADTGYTVAHERYNAVIDQNESPVMEANTQQKLDEFALDLSDLVEVTFRLIPMAMQEFRMRSVGGIYRKSTIEDIIKNILLVPSEQLELESNYKPLGVDVVQMSDKFPREQIIIPHGTRAVDAPGYIHKHCGGVYSNGFSYFYFNDYWWVWPTYDYTRFNEVEKTLTIINIPARQFPQLENTWRMQDESVIVLSTSDVKVVDNVEFNQNNLGNGVRFTSASELKEASVQTVNNKSIMSRGALNSEFTIGERHKGANVVTTAPEHITDNKHYIMSRMTRNNGIMVVMRWENSRPDLIIPGMQTRIMYLDKGEVREVQGVVIGANTNCAMTGRGVTSSTYVACTDIVLFCERIVNPLVET